MRRRRDLSPCLGRLSQYVDMQRQTYTATFTDYAGLYKESQNVAP